jgi:uncharacterized membrane protein
MAQHRAAVNVNAPAKQVYAMFSHFNDYPKFMRYVKEVTYLDAERSHWVVEIVGQHEWDAINEDWIPDRQIGWRSVAGLENSGRVTFTPVSEKQTRVDVEISYDPPGGVLGEAGEVLGAGAEFERRLAEDLHHFAFMVEAAEPGALDPESSSYLFHAHSAAEEGRTTEAQDQTMVP